MPSGAKTRPQDMELHGLALLDYYRGDAEAQILLHRDDGFVYPPIPARHWFYEDGLPEFDRTALSLCSGRVLELGAAAGSRTLILKGQGLEVTAADASRQAVEVMRLRAYATPGWRTSSGPSDRLSTR